MDMPKIKDAAGQEYTLRRLGYDDLMDLWEIAGAMFAAGGTELGARVRYLVDRRENVLEGVLLAAALGAPTVRDRFAAWVAGVLCTEADHLRDPDHFPLAVMPGVIRTVATHPDIIECVEALVGDPGGGDLVERFQHLVASWVS